MFHSRKSRFIRSGAVIGIGLPLTLACGAVRSAVVTDPGDDVASTRCLTREEARNLSSDGYLLICRDRPAMAATLAPALPALPAVSAQPVDPPAFIDAPMVPPGVAAPAPTMANRAPVLEAGDTDDTTPSFNASAEIGEVHGYDETQLMALLRRPEQAATDEAGGIVSPDGSEAGSTGIKAAGVAVIGRAAFTDTARPVAHPAHPGLPDAWDGGLASDLPAPARWARPANEWDLIDIAIEPVLPAEPVHLLPPVAAVAGQGAGQAAPRQLTHTPLPEESSVAPAADDVAGRMDSRSMAKDIPESDRDDVFGQWAMVADADLGELRGGFDLGQGMLVSFGLSRTVSVNGELVTSTSLQIPDMSHLTQAQAVMLASHLGTVQLVQNGSASAIDAAARPFGTGGGTIIQNSLNNQSIKSTTVIDASVGSLGLMKSLNTQSALRDAVLGAVPGR